MKVALYTLTRDRLEYTEHCFAKLRELAGHPYDHYVVDNGSEDGTQDWLEEQAGRHKLHHVEYLATNQGISAASNIALDAIGAGEYDLIVTIDNDCEVVTSNMLAHVVTVYESIGPHDREYVLSPRVEGVNTEIHRARVEGLGGHPIGLTGHVGGLFTVRPAALMEYRYPTDLPLASGQDSNFSSWAHRRGAFVGYIEDLVVNHYETTDGQAVRYPEYFERKRVEEITKP